MALAESTSDESSDSSSEEENEQLIKDIDEFLSTEIKEETQSQKKAKEQNEVDTIPNLCVTKIDNIKNVKLSVKDSHKDAIEDKIDKVNMVMEFKSLETRKYPLRGYILGVLSHITALDQLWGGDGTLTVWF